MSGVEPETIEGDVIEHGQEVALRPEITQQLVRAEDPAQFIAKATQIATALADVIEKKGLSVPISGKRHVKVEGWTLLGSMMGAFGQGVYAITEWTKPLHGEDGKVYGYEARVVAKTLEGNQVGSAEAMCTRDESRWRAADEYAIRSMAQTRATSKALRMPLGFIIELAGYSATPAEEMDGVQRSAPSTKPAAALAGVTAEQLQKLQAGVEKLKGVVGWSVEEIGKQASTTFGREIVALDQLREPEAKQIIEAMRSYGGIEL